MGGDYTVLSLNQNDLWNEYLNLLPPEQQDIYYTPNYYSLYQNLGDGLARCFVFQSGDNIALYPFLINSVNELGYELDKNYYDIQGVYGYNGVVASTCNREFIDMFYKAFNSYCADNNIIAEFTRFHPLLSNHKFSEDYLTIIYDRKTIYIDLRMDIVRIIKNYNKSKRYELKKALRKNDMEVKIYRNDTSILDSFINIYHDTMKRVSAVPYLYFNDKYFIDLFSRNNSATVVVYYEGKAIAAEIILIHNLYMHGHLAGTLTAYRSLDSNSLLVTEAIRYGQNMGCRYYHMGGGTTRDNDDTLFKHKKYYSNNTSDFYTGKKIHDYDVYDKIITQWNKNHLDKDRINEDILLRYRYRM